MAIEPWGFVSRLSVNTANGSRSGVCPKIAGWPLLKLAVEVTT